MFQLPFLMLLQQLTPHQPLDRSVNGEDADFRWGQADKAQRPWTQANRVLSRPRGNPSRVLWSLTDPSTCMLTPKTMNIGGVLVSIAALSSFAVASHTSTSKLPTPSTEAKEVRKEASISALGTIEPISEVYALVGPMGQFGSMPRISLIPVKEGQRVSKGQILVRFDNTAEVTSERNRIAGNIASKKEEIEILKSQTSRFEKLSNLGAYPVAELEEKKARLASYKSQLRELAGTLKTYTDRISNDTVIRSPISGTVLRINSQVGEQSRPTGVVEIGDTDTMQAILQLDEGDIDSVRVGQPVIIKSENGAFLEPVRGSISFIGLRVRPNKKLSVDPSLDTSIEDRMIEVKVLLDPESSHRTRKLTGVKIMAIIRVS